MKIRSLIICVGYLFFGLGCLPKVCFAQVRIENVDYEGSQHADELLTTKEYILSQSGPILNPKAIEATKRKAAFAGGQVIAEGTSDDAGSEGVIIGTDPVEKIFPLKKGNYWLFKGKVATTKSGTSEVIETEVTWKMEVVDTVRRDFVFAALLKGHPQDLIDYSTATQPGDYLLVAVAEKKFYLLPQALAWGAYKRLKNNDFLQDLVKEDQQILEYPLAKNQFFGETGMITRNDMMYHWWVEKEMVPDLSGVSGVKIEELKQGYKLLFRTLPGHFDIDFVPGLGITHYFYNHHGTVSQVDVRLIEFHQVKE